MSVWPRIRKILSKNDTGETGAHMGGILIPKHRIYAAYFPNLDATEKNPRAKIPFLDREGNVWYFTFLYYNNKLFGGTRNEYRLTGMTRFIDKFQLNEGDTLIFGKTCHGDYTIDCEKQEREHEQELPLRLSKSFRTIDMKS